jgi:hypothetical protein
VPIPYQHFRCEFRVECSCYSCGEGPISVDVSIGFRGVAAYIYRRHNALLRMNSNPFVQDNLQMHLAPSTLSGPRRFGLRDGFKDRRILLAYCRNGSLTDYCKVSYLIYIWLPNTSREYCVVMARLWLCSQPILYVPPRDLVPYS